MCVLCFTAGICLTFLPYSSASLSVVQKNILGAVVLVGDIGFLVYAVHLSVKLVDWPAVKAWLRNGSLATVAVAA